MRRHAVLGFIVVLPLYIAFATAIGFVDERVRPLPDHAYEKYVPEIVAGTADPPGRYRVFGPLTFQGLTRVSGLAPDDAWILFRWLGLVIVFCTGHVWFRTWFSPGVALAGNALMATLLPLTFTNSWAHPDHFLELSLFTFGCACVARRWHAGFLFVLLLAALNRETSFLLVMVFAVAEKLTPRRLVWLAAAALVWAAVYVGLRWRLGYVAYNPLHFTENLALLFWWPEGRDLYYRLYSWFFIVLLAAPVPMIVRNWRAQPRLLRGSLAIAAPVFVAICLTFSSIIETRIFTPLMPLLAAGVLFAGFEPDPSAHALP